MSWIPTLSIGGNQVKSGKTSSNGDLITITFNTPYPDNNYTVSLTPYINSNLESMPQAWVIFDSLMPESFSFRSSNADGVFWMTTYSNS